MTVKITNKQAGSVATGKYAVMQKDTVFLYSGCMVDASGNLRGCGKNLVFDAGAVSISADNPAKEIRKS